MSNKVSKPNPLLNQNSCRKLLYCGFWSVGPSSAELSLVRCQRAISFTETTNPPKRFFLQSGVECGRREREKAKRFSGDANTVLA